MFNVMALCLKRVCVCVCGGGGGGGGGGIFHDEAESRALNESQEGKVLRNYLFVGMFTQK